MPPQVLLQTSIQFSRALSNPSHFLEALHKATTLKNDIIIAFSLSLVANSFSTGQFGLLTRSLALMAYFSDDHRQDLV
jgi:hypothetical protein